MSKKLFLEVLAITVCSLVISINVNATQTVKIAIPYTDQEIAGKNENNLKIFKFDVGSQTWISLPSTPYPAKNYIEAEGDSFGNKYAVAEIKLPTVTQFICAYPSPVNKGNPLKIKFDLNQGMWVTIKIYVRDTGEFVKTLFDSRVENSGEYNFKWIVDLASGYYRVKVTLGSYTGEQIIAVY